MATAFSESTSLSHSLTIYRASTHQKLKMRIVEKEKKG